MVLTPTIKLKSNNGIPVLGFGTWGLDKGEEQSSIEYALEVGYRHLDAADIYGSHSHIANAIESIGISREDIFITTKLWKTDLSSNAARIAFLRFLDELQTGYVDLLLIHRPNPEIPIQETLEVMQEFQEEGSTRSIGVSNFRIEHIQEALDTDIDISVNQVELHPSLSEEELREFCNKHGIVITAYSPLARGYDLKLAPIIQIAEKYGRDPAQVVLNWIMQHGMVAIPKSSNKEHIKSNFQSLEWSLSDEDMALIDTLNTNDRIEEK